MNKTKIRCHSDLMTAANKRSKLRLPIDKVNFKLGLGYALYLITLFFNMSVSQKLKTLKIEYEWRFLILF